MGITGMKYHICDSSTYECIVSKNNNGLPKPPPGRDHNQAPEFDGGLAVWEWRDRRLVVAAVDRPLVFLRFDAT